MATENDTLEMSAEDMIEQANMPQGSALNAPAPTPNAPNGYLSIPQNALGKLKQEQRERGKREALSEMEARFKAGGFTSLDEAIAQLAALRAPPPAPAAPQKTQTTSQPQFDRQNDQALLESRKQMEALAKERERLARELAREQAAKRVLESGNLALQGEALLNVAAVRHGAKDSEYAVELCRRHLATLDDADYETFDEDAFFADLRKEKPYLFGETVVFANTGVGVGDAPVAPNAGTVTEAHGQSGRVDARKLTSTEFQKLLRERNLNVIA